MTDSSPHSERRSKAVHRPVLLREVLHALQLQEGLCVVDGTVGAGGHSQKICEQIGPTGKLIGLDRDTMMLALATNCLQQTASNFELVHASYAELKLVLDTRNINTVDRVLLDLGLSSDQLEDTARGFSFHSTGVLDLRFDTSTGLAAWQILEQYNQQALATVFTEFGEERFAKVIAEKIVTSRTQQPIKYANELADIVTSAMPSGLVKSSRKHPATRIFQALRIEANAEFKHLNNMLNNVLPDILPAGGRAVVITFHSLEDRMVKNAFRNSKVWKRLTSKPVSATPTEQRVNPRSRTAKIRSVERR